MFSLAMTLITSASLLLTASARSHGQEFATAHGLVFGAWTEFPSLDKTVICFIFGKRDEDGSVRWYEPTNANGTKLAFARMPRLALRADGTVFRDLLFNPFE